MDFDGLVDRYEKPIYNLIFRLMGDRDEAFDLTQETFVAAFKSFSEFKGESSTYTWLYKIAINKCKSKFRENERRRVYEGPSLQESLNSEDSTVLGDRIKTDRHPGSEMERKELREKIETAISQLPPDYRIVAVLRDIHGFSYQDIADAADLSIDVVRTRLARARGMLRHKLASYLLE